MSTDGGEMVFDEVTYREPVRARRPDRDRRWATIAYEVPAVGDLPIYLDLQPADAIERHALRDTSVELGGILLGRECLCDQTGEPFVWVTQSLEAKHYENTQASFTYTHDSWEEITRERDKFYPDLDIVGWYHTHPNFGIFLSGHDLFIHRNYFARPLLVAYVVDPIRGDRGFFRWRDDDLDRVGGYHLVAGRDDRAALARLVDDLEGVDRPPGGGLTLSPRLEAELIDMLSRPHQAPSSAAIATPAAAAAFGLVGLAAGALLVGAALWLQMIATDLKGQGAEVQRLAKAVPAARDQADIDADRERIRGKEAALDALLAQVKVGGGTEPYTVAYSRLAAERDAARSRLAAREALFDQAAEGASAQRSAAQKLNADKARLAEEAAGALLKVDALQAKLDGQAADLAAKTKILDESKAGELAAKYRYAWYAAAAGWASALLAGLGLVAMSGRPSASPPAAAPEGPVVTIT